MLALGLIRVIVYFCNQSKYRKTSLKNYSGNVGSGENIQGNTNQGLGLGKNIQSDTKSKASSQVSQGNESLDLKSKIIVGGLGSSALGAGVITGAKVITDSNKIKKPKTKSQDKDQNNGDFVYVDPAKEKAISSESLNANNSTENPKKNK